MAVVGDVDLQTTTKEQSRVYFTNEWPYLSMLTLQHARSSADRVRKYDNIDKNQRQRFNRSSRMCDEIDFPDCVKHDRQLYFGFVLWPFALIGNAAPASAKIV